MRFFRIKRLLLLQIAAMAISAAACSSNNTGGSFSPADGGGGEDVSDAALPRDSSQAAVDASNTVDSGGVIDLDSSDPNPFDN